MKSSLLFALSALLLFAACSKPAPEKLVVGMELAYPPFEMTDEQGNPTGVSVELARALGESLGREVEIQNLPFDGLIPALKTGSIDLIISSMTATEERAKSIDFSDPYVFTGLAMLTAKDSAVKGIASLREPGRVVAVKLGTTGHAYAKEHLPDTELRVLAEENACVLEVAQGKADAFFYDQMSIYKNSLKHPETTLPLLEAFQQESWAIGIRQGRDDLKGEVNVFLEEFRISGGWDRLGEKYFGEMKEAFETNKVPFVFKSADGE